MSKFRRVARQALTIARRDFTATVFTPTFLIFLFAPLIMMSFGAVGGVGAASMADGAQDKTRIVAVASGADAAALTKVDTRLRKIFRHDEAPPVFEVRMPTADPAAEARALFDANDMDVVAVMHGPLTKPVILYRGNAGRSSSYLSELAEQTVRGESGGLTQRSTPVLTQVAARETASIGGQHQTAFFAVFGIFLLTVILAGQAVGTMAEERSNKVIEVLAAAVPLESVFFGKLIGMLGTAIVFVGFWGTIVAKVGSLLPQNVVDAFGDVGPAVGLPTFMLLFFTYFILAYLLLGAVFLSVGAQASTMREIQMLSLPITIVQVGMFGLASAGASHPGSTIALVAEIFPLSSPFAMAAFAANSPLLWPHLIAILWQLLWVSIVIAIGARAFRRGVLQSGSSRGRFFRSRAVEAAAEIPLG
ncbi:hypothetical protein BH09PSE4_BH09PSE4_14330 [soil metagenome]